MSFVRFSTLFVILHRFVPREKNSIVSENELRLVSDIISIL